MEIIHMFHSIGEYHEGIGIFANSLFAVSLMHGGVHWVHVRIRRRAIDRATRARARIQG